MKKNNLIALFLMLCTACFCSCSQQEKTVTFAIASDFHAQDVPDGKERLSSFVRAAQDANADFIIELGDVWTVPIKCFMTSGTVFRETNITPSAITTWMLILPMST